MVSISHSRTHPSDVDLVERILAREDDPHLSDCVDCRSRAETLRRDIDPLIATEPAPFNDVDFRRQAAQIRSRIAEQVESHRSPWAFLFPSARRLSWGMAAFGALLVVALAFREGPSSFSPPAAEETKIASGWTEQDAADDRLLVEIDELLAEEPFDLDDDVEG